MAISTEFEKYKVLVGKLDLLYTKKNKFIEEASKLRLSILRSSKLAFNQKSDLTLSIAYKASVNGFNL